VFSVFDRRRRPNSIAAMQVEGGAQKGGKGLIYQEHVMKKGKGSRRCSTNAGEFGRFEWERVEERGEGTILKPKGVEKKDVTLTIKGKKGNWGRRIAYRR